MCNRKIFRNFLGKEVYKYPSIKILQCSKCNLVQLSSTDHIDDQYYKDDNYFGENLESIINKERSWNLKRVDLISKNFDKMQNKIALDLGCGPGGFLDVGNHIFKKLYGYDLSFRMRNWNKSRNHLILDDLDTVKDINVVVLFHVLEHIKYPLEFIEEIKQKFDNLEYLILEVPNNNELLISEFKKKEYENNHYSLEHLNYFNSKSLKKILSFSSLKIKFETQYQRYTLGNTLGWLNYGKGGFQKYFKEFNNNTFHMAYEKALVSRKVADTLFIIASLK